MQALAEKENAECHQLLVAYSPRDGGADENNAFVGVRRATSAHVLNASMPVNVWACRTQAPLTATHPHLAVAGTEPG